MSSVGTRALPAGTVLHLDASVRLFAHGTVLLGGSPLRLLRLDTQGAHLLNRWTHGEPLDTGAGKHRLARRLVNAGLLHPEPPAAPFGLQDITLVTPVKDNPTGVQRLAEATNEVADRILIDDGSCEPLPRATQRHATPAGPAAARNAGWQRARTALVAFVDADVEPEPGWLGSVLALFADPTVAAVAPRIRSRPGTGPLARYEHKRSSLDLGEQPASVYPMSRVSYVPSAALVVRREALDQLGGFDEQLRFGEDVDLVWRLLDIGWTVRYEPTSRVWHDPRPGLLTWLRQRFAYGTSAAPLSTRHPGRLSCARLSRWSALSWGLLAAGFPLSALAAAAVTTALFPVKLRGRGLPTTETLRLAGRGHLGAGRLLAEATRRTWWPCLAVAALGSHHARLVALAVVLPCVIDSAGRGPGWPFLRLLDDLAYGAGVWAGCLHERTLAPLHLQCTSPAKIL